MLTSIMGKGFKISKRIARGERQEESRAAIAYIGDVAGDLGVGFGVRQPGG